MNSGRAKAGNSGRGGNDLTGNSGQRPTLNKGEMNQATIGAGREGYVLCKYWICLYISTIFILFYIFLRNSHQNMF